MNFLRILSRDREQPKSQADVVRRINDDLSSMITRGRFMGEKLDFGPNFVHTYIKRGNSGEFGAPGSIEDLGWAHNLKTTAGMDWLHNAMFGSLAAVGSIGSPATNVTATAVTVTSTPLTSSAHIGQRIIMPVTNITTSPVYGNILSNTTSVLQIDQWWTSADGTGTTPASTNAFLIAAGMGPARFIGLTTDTGGPAVGDTSLTSEITTNGLQRALALYAHTPGATTSTLSKTFTASGTHTAVHKAGLFTGGYGASGGGVDVANTNLNADATLASGDSIAVTWTWTLPAAG
jgi:hypothetical protein